MKMEQKIADLFAKVEDSYTVTNCTNGFVITVSGNDEQENWIGGKFVFKTLDELKDTIQDLAWIPRL